MKQIWNSIKYKSHGHTAKINLNHYNIKIDKSCIEEIFLDT